MYRYRQIDRRAKVFATCPKIITAQVFLNFNETTFHELLKLDQCARLPPTACAGEYKYFSRAGSAGHSRRRHIFWSLILFVGSIYAIL
jgi:hypothetical protein